MILPWTSFPFGTIRMFRGASGRDTYGVSLADGSWCYPTTRKAAEEQRAKTLKEVEARGVQFAMCWPQPVNSKLRFRWPVGDAPAKVDGIVYESSDKRFMMRLAGTAGIVAVDCLGKQYAVDASQAMDYKVTPQDVIERLARLQRTHFFLERLLC